MMTTTQLTRHAMNQARPDYVATAQMWRSLAHTAQLEGDFEAMRLSHLRAQENEAMAKAQTTPCSTFAK
jgi:outer membrane murein-binding lipoprotein Lpp